jgi:hypothetical protein
MPPCATVWPKSEDDRATLPPAEQELWTAFDVEEDMRMRGWVAFAGIGIAASALSGCGSNPAGVGGVDADCALLVRYQGQTYFGRGVQVAPREGRLIGTGVLPGCDDGDGAEPDEEIRLAEIEGVPPEIALAWHGQGDTVFVLEGVDQLPSEVRRLTRVPQCDSRDEPIELAGPWLGILGADGHTELDLAPPYDVHVFVQETTSPRYERAFLTIRVPEELGRPLTRDDIHSSLWESGTIEFTTGCDNGRYVALRVAAYPPS